MFCVPKTRYKINIYRYYNIVHIIIIVSAYTVFCGTVTLYWVCAVYTGRVSLGSGHF